MPVQNWVNVVETNVLILLIHVTSILMIVVCALIGWELGQCLENFIVDMYSTPSVYSIGLILIADVLFVGSYVNHLWLPFMIYLMCFYQTTRYTHFSEESMIPANSTQQVSL